LLAPFAMQAAFPPSDYYGASAPPDDRQPAMSLPTSGLAGRTGGRPQVVPTFTTRSIDEAGTQLYPGSTVMTTPQTFTMTTQTSRLRARLSGDPVL
jgi:hypothetical protein